MSDHPLPPVHDNDEYLTKPGDWSLPVPRSTYTVMPGIGIQGGRVVKHGAPGWRRILGNLAPKQADGRKIVECSYCKERGLDGTGHNSRRHKK